MRLPFDLEQETSFFDDLCMIKNLALDYLYTKVDRKLDVEIDLIYENRRIYELKKIKGNLYICYATQEPIFLDSLGNEQIIQIASEVAGEEI